MPPLGTAPRRSGPGIWHTASRRPLTAAGAAYWENLYRQRRTTGTGHMLTREAPIPTRAAAANVVAQRRRMVPSPTDFALDAEIKRGQASAENPRAQAAQARVRTYRQYHKEKLGLGGVKRAVGGVTAAAAHGIEGLLPGAQWGAGGHRVRHGIAPTTSRAQEST